MWRGPLLVAIRVGSAVGLNVLLLAVLARLNRTDVVQADPVVVARLRLPEPPIRRPPPKELLPKEEPTPEDPVVELDPQDEEPPAADFEPVALPSVQLGIDVPFVARPITVVRGEPVRRRPRKHVAPPPPGRTLGSDEVDEPPRETRITKPAYPSWAIRRGIEGSATVKLLIDEWGRVERAELVDTHGSKLFGPAVLAVARDWRFVAARNGGKPVKVWALKTIRFQLRSRAGGRRS